MDRSLLVRLSKAGMIGALAVALVAAGALAVSPRAAGPARQTSTLGREDHLVSSGPATAEAAAAAVAVLVAGNKSGARTRPGPFASGLGAGGAGTVSSPVLLMYINNI